jgi:hypothetical protein
MRMFVLSGAKVELRLEASERVEFDIFKFFMSESTYLSESEAFSRWGRISVEIEPSPLLLFLKQKVHY